MASKSASLVQGVLVGSSLLRSRSRPLHNASDASTKCNSCSTFARPISSRNHSRCTLVLPGKSSTTEIPFDNRAQTRGVIAFFNREERLTNPGMSVISPGNSASKKSSCTRSTASSRLTKSLARVDFPAAIFPQNKINFAEFFWCIWTKISRPTSKVPIGYRAVAQTSSAAEDFACRAPRF